MKRPECHKCGSPLVYRSGRWPIGECEPCGGWPRVSPLVVEAVEDVLREREEGEFVDLPLSAVAEMACFAALSFSEDAEAELVALAEREERR